MPHFEAACRRIAFCAVTFPLSYSEGETVGHDCKVFSWVIALSVDKLSVQGQGQGISSSCVIAHGQSNYNQPHSTVFSESSSHHDRSFKDLERMESSKPFSAGDDCGKRRTTTTTTIKTTTMTTTTTTTEMERELVWKKKEEVVDGEEFWRFATSPSM